MPRAAETHKPPSATLARLHARCSAATERRIRMLAAAEDTTVQSLILRALSAAIVARGLPPLDEPDVKIGK